MDKLTIDDLQQSDIRGRVVLVRVDYNVPLGAAGEVTDDTRIRSTIPTLERLVGMGGRIVLLAHFGRPKGRPVPEMSLRPVAAHLAGLMKRDIAFEPGGAADAGPAVERLGEGDLLLLENMRFDPREEANDPGLATELAGLADVFVNDAFGAAHRAHASTAAVADLIRDRGGLAVAGLLMKRELDYLGSALADPERPFVAILGGAKISGKIDVIEALLPRTDSLLIGGAMANTFFLAMGLHLGASLVEDDRVEMAGRLLDRAGDRLILPEDLVVAKAVEPGAETRVVRREEIPDGWKALDIGPDSVRLYSDVIRGSRTVLWNGPMGVAEIAEFRNGTEGVARALADATTSGATTIVGGGDSAAALVDLGLDDRVSHLSTGGGASLEFLEGRALPGVDALSSRSDAR